MNRRFFLKNSGVALASISAATMSPSFLTRALAQSNGNGRRKILIAVFQRGAMDGLNAVIPYGDQDYYYLRSSIAIPRPGVQASVQASVQGGPTNQAPAIDLDGFFGLHPALAPFKPIYDSGQLAVIHASGSHDNTRSHFDAQDYMESATPGVKSTADGWLNRCLQATDDSNASPFRGVVMGPNLPRVMQGKASAIAMNNINDFTIRAGGGDMGQAVQGGFEAMYAQTVNDALRGAGKETFDAMKLLKRVNPAQYQPAPGVIYPRGPFGDRLRQIAQLIKSDIGLEVAFTDIGGWDTHANQGASQGQLALRLTELAQGLSAIYADLKERADDVVILTMTEFGRTAKENGNRGTDHGHASAMFALGGSINGGKVYGKWPGLKDNQLHEGRDLAITTDFRDVFAELAKNHLGATRLNTIFPGYQINTSNFKGLIRA
ncbi:MAG TPA: DUF1501 domain-containing protein [Blastocatellia bacterium]|nr:DUF1501 domain-containing protein [Blastocatellia bacterium]